MAQMHHYEETGESPWKNARAFRVRYNKWKEEQ